MEHKFLVFICNPGLLKQWLTIIVVNPFLIFEKADNSESSETDMQAVGWFVFDSIGDSLYCPETGLKGTLGNKADHVIPQVCHFLNVVHHTSIPLTPRKETVNPISTRNFLETLNAQMEPLSFLALTLTLFPF